MLAKTEFVRVRQWWLPSAALLACAVIIFHEFFQITIVVGDSMLPTLEPGELLLVSRRAYRHTEPQRGDIVMARYGADFILKRIVGLPTEEVEVKHGTLYINGAALQENHGIEEGPLDVSKGKMFDGDFATLGDNRQIPAVLAIHPILSKTDIAGKVILNFRKMF